MAIVVVFKFVVVENASVVVVEAVNGDEENVVGSSVVTSRVVATVVDPTIVLVIVEC